MLMEEKLCTKTSPIWKIIRKNSWKNMIIFKALKNNNKKENKIKNVELLGRIFLQDWKGWQENFWIVFLSKIEKMRRKRSRKRMRRERERGGKRERGRQNQHGYNAAHHFFSTSFYNYFFLKNLSLKTSIAPEAWLKQKKTTPCRLKPFIVVIRHCNLPLIFVHLKITLVIVIVNWWSTWWSGHTPKI